MLYRNIKFVIQGKIYALLMKGIVLKNILINGSLISILVYFETSYEHFKINFLKVKLSIFSISKTKIILCVYNFL